MGSLDWPVPSLRTQLAVSFLVETDIHKITSITAVAVSSNNIQRWYPNGLMLLWKRSRLWKSCTIVALSVVVERLPYLTLCRLNNLTYNDQIKVNIHMRTHGIHPMTDSSGHTHSDDRDVPDWWKCKLWRTRPIWHLLRRTYRGYCNLLVEKQFLTLVYWLIHITN